MYYDHEGTLLNENAIIIYYRLYLFSFAYFIMKSQKIYLTYFSRFYYNYL